MARGTLTLPATVVLSRPDNLGDAVVTLPMAGWIKKHAPGTRIIVLAKRYTRTIWEHAVHVDGVLDLEELQGLGDHAAAEVLRRTGAGALFHVFPRRDVAGWAKQAGIHWRVGTSHRWWHWMNCNLRVGFSRKKSDLHEAQLNLKLCGPFGIPVPARVEELVPYIGLRMPEPDAAISGILRRDRKNVILHPLKASGVEWGLHNFARLIEVLDPDRYHCIITGTAAEAGLYRKALPVSLPHVSDTGGALSLEQLMAVIGRADALVAASTGPLHLAAAAGIRTIGLFSTQRPIHPGRWAPLGPDVHVLVPNGQGPNGPAPLSSIPPERVLELLPH